MVKPVDHPIRLHSPHYADPADGTVLHRYLEEQFVPRFLQEASTGRLTGNAHQGWRGTDRFGRFRDLPTLRLPLHRTFHIACCEVSCAIPGAPALDSARIESAGLVIRRGRDGGNAQRWLLREGEPQGWRGGEVPSHDPDEYRRLRGRGLVPPRVPEPAFSGEETYPLHPLVVTRPGPGGRSRSHTLLFGYLPLGGSYRLSPGSTPEVAADAPAPDYPAEHRWPFGSLGRQEWRQADGLVVSGGAANPAFRELLATLLGRYRVQDGRLPENAALRALLGRIHFYAPTPRLAARGGDPELDPTSQVQTLLAYLDGRSEQLLEWLAVIDRGQRPADYGLPAASGPASPESEANLARRSDALYVTEAQAEQLRDLLVIRAERAAQVSADALPIPRFGQSEDDIYFVKPFLRYLDAQGCPQIAWGPASAPFRVVAPLDPEAARPQLVVLPELDDLKRGIAKGVTFLSPKSVADKIQRLKLDMDVKADGPGNRAGACWSFSFSIPIITLCAMILLMIMINLLNFLFRWLPWAILALPRICLRIAGRGGG